MLISGKKNRAVRDKKKILNETINDNPPSLQVKWSVPNGHHNTEFGT